MQLVLWPYNAVIYIEMEQIEKIQLRKSSCNSLEVCGAETAPGMAAAEPT